MRFYEEKKRLNITVPVKLYNLLERDSIMYGMSKSTYYVWYVKINHSSKCYCSLLPG